MSYDLLSIPNGHFHPGLSIDCVIFGFYKGELKILLNKFHNLPKWMLPGGFVLKNEDVNVAAHRILQERTGLEQLYLEQFYLFGECNRSDVEMKLTSFNRKLTDEEMHTHWFMQRFVSLGYYALVDFSKVHLNAGLCDEQCEWFHIKDVPQLCFDHNRILEKALTTLRRQVGIIPIGYELLPEKFLMSDLRTLYETILGHAMDRRNFQRKLLASGVVKQLDEMYTEGAFKPAYLYCFNKEYFEKRF